MKIKALMLAAMPAILLLGCAKEANQNETAEPKIFTAGFETPSTKTYIDADGNHYWTAEDQVSIFTSTYNQQYKFAGKTGDNAGAFNPVSAGTFTTGFELPNNYAVYPYSEATSIDYKGNLTISLPAVQQYAEGSFGLGANTMVAVSSSSTDLFLPFKNVCGYVAVNVFGNTTAKSVSIKGNSGEKIAGAAVVAASHDAMPFVTMGAEATDSIALVCGDGVQVGATEAEATTFWIAVPPTTFESGFTITIWDAKGDKHIKRTTKSQTVERNVCLKMPAYEVNNVDRTAPVFVSATVTPNPVDVTDGSQTIKIRIHVTDDTGVTTIPSPDLYMPSGYLTTSSLKLISGTKKDGVYEGTFSIDNSKPAGKWHINVGYFKDATLNKATTTVYFDVINYK